MQQLIAQSMLAILLLMPLVFKEHIRCRENLLCCCVQGRTALHHAACEANHVIVSMLLEHGADLHARDNQARQKLMKYTKLTAVLWLFWLCLLTSPPIQTLSCWPCGSGALCT